MSLKVAMEFIPNLNLELNLEFNLNFKSLIMELTEVLYEKKIKDEEAFSYLKHIQKETEKFQINSNITFNKAFCKYPNKQIYIKKYVPEYAGCDSVIGNLRWGKIFKDIDLNNTFNSVVYKIYAIDLLYKTYGKYTPGFDNVKF